MFGLRAYGRGFTLIELMVAVAVAAILASIALPSYTAYIKRSRIPAGLDALSSLAVRMEQRFQDTGAYADSAGTGCGVSPPPEADNFTITCALRDIDAKNKGFTATATGSGVLGGYIYTINDAGVRKTERHPVSLPGKDCWSIRGGLCDA